jgi:cytochrome c
LKSILYCVLFSFYCVGANATSNDVSSYALAKQNACLGCHAPDKKIVGPSFQAVAKKYANDPNATIFLKNKILRGGSGSWGVIPMPANAKLSDAELSTLTNWILRGAPGAN